MATKIRITGVTPTWDTAIDVLMKAAQHFRAREGAALVVTIDGHKLITEKIVDVRFIDGGLEFDVEPPELPPARTR